jgi:hypothetical protein
MKTRTHWTISALKEFETCPAKYQWSYLYDATDWRKLGYKIVPSTGSPAMDRGTAVHQTCEDFVNGTSPTLHPEIKPYWLPKIKSLKDLGAVAEQQWELDEDWHPLPDEYVVKEGEKSPLWLRMKIDAHYRPTKDALVVIDYKTGRQYPENMAQIEVYALGALSMNDDVQEVTGALWYLDQEVTDEKTFKRSDAPKLARRWERRANRLLGAVQYPPCVNRFCNWCAFNAKKGGPCNAAP